MTVAVRSACDVVTTLLVVEGIELEYLRNVLQQLAVRSACHVVATLLVVQGIELKWL